MPKISASKTEISAGPPLKTYNRRFVYLLACVGALGGLLFGYDTGVISGALLFLRDEFHLGPAMQGMITASVLLGAVISSATSGILADHYGRRTMLIFAAVLFAIGAVITGLGPDIYWLVGGRLVVGFAIGIASYTSPLYISESAPAGIRGALVSLSQLLITVGIVVAYLVDYVFAYPTGWRWMFGLAIFPALGLGVGMFFLPDSPRSLINRGYKEKAKQVLTRIHGTSEAGLIEMEKISRIAKLDEDLGRVGWKELLLPAVRPALIVGIGLAVFQQFVGINTIIYYAPTIFEWAGFSSHAGAILATGGVGMANVLMTLAAMVLLDRWGRRPLLFVGLAGMIITLVWLGINFLRPEAERGGVAVLVLTLYVASFAISLGPIFWLIISEIYPLRVRGRAMSIATFANWLSNMLIGFTFPLLIVGLGAPITFWFYALIGIAALVFTYRLVPETKGRTLEEIEAHWFKSG
jgi:MFS transporter, SP family, galactose:H+ symporter